MSNVSGEGAQLVINPQGQVTQIGTVVNNTKVPPGLRRLAVVGVVVLVVVLIAVVGNLISSQDQARGLSKIESIVDVTPTATSEPIQMTGAFNVIVAEFGELDSQGNISDSQAGQWLSSWLAQQLQAEFTATNLAIEVWQDRLNKPASNPTIGIVTDDAEAQAQMDKFGAEMLIYGTLDSTQDPAALQLNFAWSIPPLQDGPDAVNGHEKLGESVPIANLGEAALYKREVANNPTLWRRVNVLIWLSQGLVNGLLGDHVAARDVLLAAANKLDATKETAERPENDGTQLLYYFLGREYLTLHQLDDAEAKFKEAIGLDPNYVNAHIGLGNVFFDKASFYFIQQQPLANGLNTCKDAIDSEQLAAISGQLPITVSQALSASQQAVDSYQLALDKAPGSAWKPMETVAQYMLGRGYRLKGDAARLVGPAYWPQASDDLIKAEELISPTLQLFDQDQYHGLLAYAYFDLASAQRARGAIFERQANSESDVQRSQAYTEQALAAYTSALDNYQQCSAQQSLRDANGEHIMQERIACFCEGYEILVGKHIGDLGGASG